MALGRDSIFHKYPAVAIDLSEIVNTPSIATVILSIDILFSLQDQENHLCHTPESALWIKQSSRPRAHELTPTPALTRPPKSSSLLQFEPSHQRCFKCESLPG